MKRAKKNSLNAKPGTHPVASFALVFALFLGLASGCASTKSFLGLGSKDEGKQPPIRNPFMAGAAAAPGAANQNMVLRTRRGDRSVELEFPAGSSEYGDLVMPLSSTLKTGDRAPASVADGAGGAEGTSPTDDRYKEKAPTLSDREITGEFSQAAFADQGRRTELEQQMGLTPPADSVPEQSTSYLAGIDHIKQLYNHGRYEAALLEADEMVRLYPTDPKLYEMRGTLLDRMGRAELALKAWEQSLRFNPRNTSLKKFIERKRGIASFNSTVGETPSAPVAAPAAVPMPADDLRSTPPAPAASQATSAPISAPQEGSP